MTKKYGQEGYEEKGSDLSVLHQIETITLENSDGDRIEVSRSIAGDHDGSGRDDSITEKIEKGDYKSK
jgi:hypothetical protein